MPFGVESRLFELPSPRCPLSPRARPLKSSWQTTGRVLSSSSSPINDIAGRAIKSLLLNVWMSGSCCLRQTLANRACVGVRSVRRGAVDRSLDTLDRLRSAPYGPGSRNKLAPSVLLTCMPNCSRAGASPDVRGRVARSARVWDTCGRHGRRERGQPPRVL